MQYMDVMRPTDKVDKTLGCVCLSWSTDEEINHGMARITGALEREYLSAELCSGMESLQTMQCCVNVLRENHVFELFTERISWVLRWFCVNMFYSDI